MSEQSTSLFKGQQILVIFLQIIISLSFLIWSTNEKHYMQAMLSPYNGTVAV